MTPLPITDATLTTGLGAGLQAHLAALQAQRCALQPCVFEDVELPGWIGRAEGVEDVVLPDALASYDCRNNRLAWLALQQDGFLAAVQAARARWGAHRVAVLLGTSTSGILETEHAFTRRDAAGALPPDFDYAHTHSTASLARFVADALALAGPAWVVSTACSSSAKVFGEQLQRMESVQGGEAQAVDAADDGGVDPAGLDQARGVAEHLGAGGAGGGHHPGGTGQRQGAVSYTHLRAHET